MSKHLFQLSNFTDFRALYLTFFPLQTVGILEHFTDLLKTDNYLDI